jgi:hypothetical protein
MILKRKGALREAQRYAELNFYLCSRSIFQKRYMGKWDDLTVSFKIALGGKNHAKANIY